MPFFQGATDFEINGGSFQDMNEQHNYHRNDSFNIHGNNNKTDFAPNYSRTDNRVYDSRNMSPQGYIPPEQNYPMGSLPQSYASSLNYEQLYQIQLLELQRANLQLRLAATTAASQPNIPSSQPIWSPHQPQLPSPQQLPSPPQFLPPSMPPPPSLPQLPPFPQISPQPASFHQQHPHVPAPDTVEGQSPSMGHAQPGLGAIGALQQRFEHLAQQASTHTPTQPSPPQQPPPAAAISQTPPAATVQTQVHQGAPQRPPYISGPVPSPYVVSPAPISAVGLSPNNSPHVVRPTTASSSSSRSSSSSDSSRERKVGSVPTMAPLLSSGSPHTIPVNAAPLNRTTPAVSAHHASSIVNAGPPQLSTAQIMGTGPLPTPQAADASVASSTTQVNGTATSSNSVHPVSSGPGTVQMPQNPSTSPLRDNFAMYPVPVPTTNTAVAPSTGAISSITVRPLLSFPTPSTPLPSNSTPSGTPITPPAPGTPGNNPGTSEKKKRRSWLPRFNSFKKKSKD